MREIMIGKILFSLFVGLASILAAVRIGIISDSAYFGEREIGWRIKRAAESLGWEVFLDESRGRMIQRIQDLDWTISLMATDSPKPKGLNYMSVFHPFGLLDQEKKLNPFYEAFDGYLLTLKPQFFDGVFRSERKKFYSIPFYPTTQPVPYKKVSLNYLVMILPTWGHRQTSERYRTLYRLLSESGFVKFYGPNDSERSIQKGYMGSVPFDGISMINILQKHGIALVIHSWHHRRWEIPSGRIFEAAAASAVIISDKNSFVQEQFGDSVYYIDINLPVEEVFRQIADRMEAIFQNPEEALSKAKQAHQIFTDRFQMTDQLLKLHAMHGEILRQK